LRVRTGETWDWIPPKTQDVNYRYLLWVRHRSGGTLSWRRLRRAFLRTGGVWKEVFRVPMPVAPVGTLTLTKTAPADVLAELDFLNPPPTLDPFPGDEPYEYFDGEVEWAYGYSAATPFTVTTFFTGGGAGGLDSASRSFPGLDNVSNTDFYVKARHRFVRNGEYGEWSDFTPVVSKNITVQVAPPAPSVVVSDVTYCEDVGGGEFEPRYVIHVFQSPLSAFPIEVSIDAAPPYTVTNVNSYYSSVTPAGFGSGQFFTHTVVAGGTYNLAMRAYNAANDPGFQYSSYVYDTVNITAIDPCGGG
jgi:hypothetical protein